jgi:hypothetical protein
MASIGVGWNGIGAVLPLPRSNVGHRIGDWIAGVVEATRARMRTQAGQREPKNRYHHPHREGFLEDAAMSREMFRL